MHLHLQICYIRRSFSLCDKLLCMLSDCIHVSPPGSVVAPATQGRPLDDRNLFRLCNQYLSALDGNCFGTWNCPVAQITACTIHPSSYHHHKSYCFIVSTFRKWHKLCNPAEREWHSPWKSIPSCG